MPTRTCLRLWKAEAAESFDFDAFNVGDYYGAVEPEGRVRDHLEGALPERRARGRQAAAARAAVLLRVVLAPGHDPPAAARKPLDEFADKLGRQLNDTHPSIAVAELMRLLVDEHDGLGSGVGDHPANVRLHEPHAAAGGARDVAAAAASAALLPRHLEIIYEINRRFLDEVRRRSRRRGPARGACR